MPDSARGTNGPGPLHSRLRSNARYDLWRSQRRHWRPASWRDRDRGEQGDQRHARDGDQLGWPLRLSRPAARRVQPTTELEGFRTGTRDIELRVQQVLRVNFALELATLEESATVVGVSPLVETSNATVGTVIENRRIVELPLNGRNYLQLVALSPNVSADFAGPGQAGDRQGGTRANQQLSISGQRREFNNYTLDGVDNTDVNFNTYIFLPSVDALEEFKVQTGVYSAEFGRAASQVNVVTKSGTNAYNGTLFWFHRDDAWDAKPYSFTPQQFAAPMAPFKWDQYGYTFTGPVMRNRLFFMSNFEGYRDRKQFQTPFSVPSSAMRNGNFSELLNNLGPVNPQTGQPAGIVVDPTQCTVVGTTRSCAPFPGNIIPAGRIHPHRRSCSSSTRNPTAAPADS